MNEQSLFIAAIDIGDPRRRAAYLDRACAGNSQLREQVESLLAAHERSGEFLNVPALQQMGAAGAEESNPGGATSIEQPAPQGKIDLSFLEPSAAPGSLGRLMHYEVRQVIGRGGCGIVLQAFDTRLERIVAVKIMAPELAVTSPARKRFLREARATAAIRHENVVNIHAVEERPLPFLVMEYIDGPTLQQKLDQTGPLDVRDVLRIGRQTACGLGAAHAQGLIHRDIKPGNILLEEGSGRVKITDFGLARSADDASLTQSGVIAGTPLYMSPEQAQGRDIDPRSDLFSLGSVLYVMCSGRPPFRAATTLAVLKRVVEEQPRPIQEIIPETPDWLIAIIARLHAKSPEGRFDSAEQVAELLGRCLSELERCGNVDALQDILPPSAPAVAAPVILTEKLDRPTRRSRPLARWTVAAAAVAMLLGGLGLSEATGITNIRGTVIRLFTPDGTLVVEVDDPGVSVSIDGEEIVITGAGVKELRLEPGQYKVLASKDGQVVRQELVTITRNGRQVVRVSREVPSAQADRVNNERPSSDFALHFDGTSGKVNIKTLKYDGSHPITLEAYVTPRRGGNSNVNIVGDHLDGGIMLTIDRNRYWAFVIGAGPKITRIQSTEPFQVGQRVHLAGSWDHKTARLFINGREVASAPASPDEYVPSPAYSNFAVGAYRSWGGYFNGTIDQVRISKTARYGSAFTPEERYEPDENTLALYHFDEGAGDVLHDSSGNGHHGKIAGAKWPKVDPLSEYANFALEFDGEKSHVLIPLDGVKHDVPLTIEAFVDLPEIIPAKGDWTETRHIWNFPQDPAPHVTQTANQNSTKWEIIGTARGEGRVHTAGPGPRDRVNYGPGRYHIAFVWRGKFDGALYINGVRIPITGSYADKSNEPAQAELVLGAKRRGKGVYSFFVGRLDELRVSTKARYSSNFTPPGANERFEPDEHTLALYHFDEGAGNMLRDSSGNNHHGKIVGAKWVPVDGTAEGDAPLGGPVELPPGEWVPLLADQRQFAQWSMPKHKVDYVSFADGELKMSSTGNDHHVWIDRQLDATDFIVHVEHFKEGFHAGLYFIMGDLSYGHVHFDGGFEAHELWRNKRLWRDKRTRQGASKMLLRRGVPPGRGKGRGDRSTTSFSTAV